LPLYHSDCLLSAESLFVAPTFLKSQHLTNQLVGLDCGATPNFSLSRIAPVHSRLALFLLFFLSFRFTVDFFLLRFARRFKAFVWIAPFLSSSASCLLARFTPFCLLLPFFVVILLGFDLAFFLERSILTLCFSICFFLPSLCSPPLGRLVLLSIITLFRSLPSLLVPPGPLPPQIPADITGDLMFVLELFHLLIYSPAPWASPSILLFSLRAYGCHPPVDLFLLHFRFFPSDQERVNPLFPFQHFSDACRRVYLSVSLFSSPFSVTRVAPLFLSWFFPGLWVFRHCLLISPFYWSWSLLFLVLSSSFIFQFFLVVRCSRVFLLLCVPFAHDLSPDLVLVRLRVSFHQVPVD